MSETVTMTLADFLLARIAEDEAAARAAHDVDDGERWAVGGLRYDARFDAVVMLNASQEQVAHANEPDAVHIARHDPARVLAECEVKRKIIVALCIPHHERRPTEVPGRYDVVTVFTPMDEAYGDVVIPLLALPYADHPDYRQEWAS